MTCCWLVCIGLSGIAQAAPLVLKLDTMECPQTSSLAKSECREPELKRDASRIQQQDNQCRFLDDKGKALGSRWYEMCGSYYIQDVVIACVPGPGNPVGCGLVNRQGEVILPTIYQKVRISPESAIASIRLSDKWGFFDLSQRKVILAPQFAYVTDFSEGYAYVEGLSEEEDGSGWFINSEGARMAAVPAGAQSIGPFRNGLAKAMSAGRWGYLNPKAEWAIAAQFMDATDFIGGQAMVKAARNPEQWALIDISGKGLVFFEGVSHSLKTWQGSSLLIEYGCDVRDSVALVESCTMVCFTINQASVAPLKTLACSLVTERP